MNMPRRCRITYHGVATQHAKTDMKNLIEKTAAETNGRCVRRYPGPVPLRLVPRQFAAGVIICGSADPGKCPWGDGRLGRETRRGPRDPGSTGRRAAAGGLAKAHVDGT